MDKIIIKGAREHNLKNIDVEIPRDRLTIISGLSGSGKSSLAFDTIFAEGQRRYVESLSAYARQFLGRLDKPDIDYIEGLSPAISIEQKTTHRNPRSTVGTVTEVYDYLRLLYARAGTPHCPSCGRVIREQAIDQIIGAVLAFPKGSRIMVLAPVVQDRKGAHTRIFTDAVKAGFVRCRIDGEIIPLDPVPELDKNKRHTVDLVIDRIRLSSDSRKRISESLETALQVADGQVTVFLADENREEFFSQKSACPECGISMPELQPRLFSFNNPHGACPECSGLGMTMEFDPERIIPDPSKSFNQGGVATANPEAAWHRSIFKSVAEHFGFDLDTPLGALPEDVYRALLYGTDEKIEFKYINKKKTGKFEYTSSYKGILADLKRRYIESTSEGVKAWLEEFMRRAPCTACGGTRLRPESLAVTVGGRDIHSVTVMSVSDAVEFFDTVELTRTESEIAFQILKEIKARLTFMRDVGLDYLTLERQASTLSGGEAQRIRLATQIGSQLVGVLYILDEPTIGLHQRDNTRLIDTLIKLRDIGNTLIIVEHDEQMLRSADHIIDLGPGAGVHGGHIIAQGTLDEIIASPESLTGRYLRGDLQMDDQGRRRQGNGKTITVFGACEHNLKNIDVSIPLGCLCVITGVSGSGKSTLLGDILYPALMNRVSRGRRTEGKYSRIEGVEHIDKVINIDQDPIGRTPRSNPATYVGLFGPIRNLFAALPEAKARGYKAGRFSFNVKGGRCENCKGEGTLKIEMHFLPDVYITCDTCRGKRFNRETLDIRYKGCNIHDVLEMTVEEATEFFENVPTVKNKLDTLMAVGLDYIKLGQSALTLSGGEAQRVKLSLELSKRSTGKTVFLLDEPTTGLHFADVKRLMDVLQLLTDKGNTVILIEHNLDVIRLSDYVIDLGPEGGDRGGRLVITGSPEDVADCPASYTGEFLRTVLKG